MFEKGQSVMKPIQLAMVALVLGAVTNCAVYSQPPGYGAPPPGQPGYGYNNGYDSGSGPQVDVGFFYNELSPYGDWVQTRDYGWAWFPRNVAPYWRPYQDGRWVDSEYGWTWVSNEPFGWATYHYGRWALDPRFGWLWIPGTVWGPAWVSWQSGGGYVGWAPLPPAVGFEIGIGLRLGGFDLNIGIRPDAYSFVPERSFLQPRVSGYLLPTARNITIIHNTTNITNYTYIDNRVVNRGLDVRQIERVTGRKVQRFGIAEAPARTRSEVSGREVRIYRPDKQRLDSVRSGPRANAGWRDQPPAQVRDQGRPAGQRTSPPEIVVAPRVQRVPPPDSQQIQQQDRRQKQQLDRYLANEKQKLDKIHQQELAKTKAKADRQKVDQRHQAELQALQQEQRNAAQQLQARQQAMRDAAVKSAPPEKQNQKDKKNVKSSPPEKQHQKADQKSSAQQQDKKKGKDQQKKAKGQDKKPEPPPPPPVLNRF